MAIARGIGNILDCDVDALVNPVNTVGAMGKGLARAVKVKYPDVFASYARACKANQVAIGRMHVVERSSAPRYVINFPTKQHFRQPSQLEYIETGLVDLVAQVRALAIESIAIPALGCGLGGLAWELVRPRIVAALDSSHARVILFEPT